MKGPNNRTPGIRLLIVAEPGLIRDGLLSLFGSAADLQAAATEAQVVARAAELFGPHVVLIDLTLPEGQALQAARVIRRRCPRVGLLFLDDVLRPARLCAVLTARGDGYWTRRASFDELTVALWAVAAGEVSFCPDARPYLVATARGLRYRPSVDGSAVTRLSRRELEVLVLLAEGLSVKRCAQQMQLAPRTVDNHKSRLMKKLGIHKVVNLARLAVREGLVGEG